MLNKKLFWALLALAITLVSFTICHMYGPFMGKVVDAEIGEPIKGTVVLIAFYTKAYTVGGWSWSFADAAETLTDGNGEFLLPQKFVYSFRALSIWDKDCQISIFKPGFGAYPNHPLAISVPKLQKSMFIPEDEYIIFHLPKLVTREEREENLLNISIPGGTTNDKMTLLLKLQHEEHKYVFGP